MSTKKKADLKVVLIGPAGAGKTCLVIRYINDRFDATDTTLGASFFLKQWGPHNIAVWDTAGEERFSGLSNFYCRDVGAAVMTYDITNHHSFEELRSRFLGMLPDDNCLRVVVGAKLDLVTDDSSRAVTRQEARQFAMEINKNFLEKVKDVSIPFFETSSKTGEGVTQAFEYLFEQCLSPLAPEYRIKSKTGTIDISKEETKSEHYSDARRKKCC